MAANPRGAVRDDVTNAIAEALQWLQTMGLAMHDPGQPTPWLILTRRGKSVKSRATMSATVF